MTQATILASGVTEADSSAVTITPGSSGKVGLFASSGGVPAGARADVFETTPGGSVFVKQLTGGDPHCVLPGGGYIVTRRAAATAFGIYSDT
jgi:hypothetical protein